jgi:hypothetical protein
VNPPAGEAVRRWPDWLWAAAAALGLGLVAWQAMTAGSWIDEYWQLWISGAPASDLPARLAADTHPPWFNLFARPIVLATGGAIVPARLINLVLAVAALGAGLWRIAGLDRTLRWRILLLIVASAGAVGMSNLALSFRSYVWLLSLSTLQAALLAALALKRPVPPVLAAIVTAASIALHYVHSAGAIAIAVVSLALAWRQDRGAFCAILAGLAVGVALDLVTGLLQISHWRVNYDVNWIAESGGGGAVRNLAALFSDFFTCNFVAVAMLAVGLIIRRSRAALMLLAPIPVAFVGWLILNASAPMLMPRFMVSVTSLLATAAAVAWWELALAPAANAALACLAALQPLAASFIRPPVAGWEGGARVAAKFVRACPGGRLYAVSPWRFRGHPDSKMERFEDPVIAFGYRKAGGTYGLDPLFVTGPTTIALGPCPATIWIEAAHGIESVPPATILRYAQLRLAAPARASVVATPNGGVLLISPADRLQPRP